MHLLYYCSHTNYGLAVREFVVRGNFQEPNPRERRGISCIALGGRLINDFFQFLFSKRLISSSVKVQLAKLFMQ